MEILHRSAERPTQAVAPSGPRIPLIPLCENSLQHFQFFVPPMHPVTPRPQPLHEMILIARRQTGVQSPEWGGSPGAGEPIQPGTEREAVR